MVVPGVLWQYWQQQQYEEAITEVCGLLDVKEESFNSDQELLAAAGDLCHDRSIGTRESLEAENLALFGCSCCNRLAEKHLRLDWRVAAHWCALARRLEGDASASSSAGRWALVRFKRLFNAAEAIRVAGKDAEKNGVPEYHLQASQRCLRACEAIWLRWPSCSSSPESIYTCLAEVCWQLKDMESVRSSCRKALSLFMSTDRLTPAKVYACMFVLWVFQSAALEVFSWREVRAALHCAKYMFDRLQACGLSMQDLRPHCRILKRLQRQGQVVPMAPLGLAEAQQELGLDFLAGSKSDQFQDASHPVRKSEVAIMTEPEEPPPPPPPDDECAEVLAFLESLDVEAANTERRKQGCLDTLLSAAEAAMEEGGHHKSKAQVKLDTTGRRWKRRCGPRVLLEEHPPPWLSVPFVHEAWPCDSIDSEAQEASSTPSLNAGPSIPSPAAKAELEEPESKEVATSPVSPAPEAVRSHPICMHKIVRKPAVPPAPRGQVSSARTLRSMSCDRPPLPAKPRPRTGRSVSLHFDEPDCQTIPREKRERRKAPLPKWSPRPNSGYTRPAASLRPAVPVACKPFVSGHSADECSTAQVSCSSGSTEVLSRPSMSNRGHKASSASLSVGSAVPEPVNVDANDVPWAFRGIRRQIEPPHLHFGHIPRRPAFEGER